MGLSLPTTRAGWIALSLTVLAVTGFLYFATNVFKGHAVEVSVQNASPSEIFASIDSTGRHGETTEVVRMATTGGKMTAPGLRIKQGGLRSFGLAVGFFDSPTLHVWEITSAGLADDSNVHDCAFDTIEYSKPKLPSPHVKLTWKEHACQRDATP